MVSAKTRSSSELCEPGHRSERASEPAGGGAGSGAGCVALGGQGVVLGESWRASVAALARVQHERWHQRVRKHPALRNHRPLRDPAGNNRIYKGS